MKNLFFYFAILVFQFGLAQTPEEQFAKANEAYADANYKEATRLYEKLIDADWQSPELHFNLANTYYKVGEIAPSIYHYEMALLLSPGNKTYQNNLKFAEQKRIDELQPIQKSSFDQKIEGLINALSLNQWAKLSILFAVLSVFCFAIFLFLKKTAIKRMGFTLFIFFTLSCVFSFYMADKQLFLSEENMYGIVFAEELNVYAEPNATSNQLFTLHEGTKIKVEDEFRNFTKIRLGNNVTGWVESKAVKSLRF